MRALHHTDHHGDFVVVTDADLGVGVPGGAEGAQVCDVLLKLGQGRAAGESPLVLVCIFVLRSHGHHLRGIACPAAAARPDRGRVTGFYWLPMMRPWAAPGQGQRARKNSLLAGLLGSCHPGPSGAVPAHGLMSSAPPVE